MINNPNINLKTYETSKILKLPINHIFVFGSNTEGKHKKGAALTATDYFGAIYGQAAGLMNQCYAIVTKNLKAKVHPSITPFLITSQIETLYNYAIFNKHLKFVVAYQNTTNLNGYTPEEMASMFVEAAKFNDYYIPTNFIFHESFACLLSSYKIVV